MSKRIEELAVESGLAYQRQDGKYWIDAGFVDADLERFVELVRQDERDRFVKFLMDLDANYEGNHNFYKFAANLFKEVT